MHLYTSLSSVGVMPSLDDSDCQMMKQGDSRQPTSPFIERNPEIFADHVKSLLGRRKEIQFNKLLPRESSQKTAGVAFLTYSVSTCTPLLNCAHVYVKSV